MFKIKDRVQVIAKDDLPEEKKHYGAPDGWNTRKLAFCGKRGTVTDICKSTVEGDRTVYEVIFDGSRRPSLIKWFAEDLEPETEMPAAEEQLEIEPIVAVSVSRPTAKVLQVDVSSGGEIVLTGTGYVVEESPFALASALMAAAMRAAEKAAAAEGK